MKLFFKLSLFSLIFVLFATSVQGKKTQKIKPQSRPIAAEELFVNSLNYSYQLSPTAEVIARHYFRGDEYNVIELIDVKNNRRADAFRIKVKKEAYIRSYSWVDGDTLYVEYKKGKNQFRKIFVDIDIPKFLKEGGETSSVRQISFKGRIVDTLPFRDNLVLFQKYSSRDDEVKAYYMTTEDVYAGNLIRAKEFENKLDDVRVYYTDASGDIRYGVTLDDGKVTFWYLTEQENQWIEFFTNRDDELVFRPIGKLSGDKFAVITDKDTNTDALVEFDVKTQEFGKVLFQHPKYDVTGADIDPETNTLKSVNYFDHGRYVTHYFSKKDLKLEKLIKKHLPNKQHFIASEVPGKNIKIIKTFAGNDPGHYFLVDTENSRFSPLEASFPELAKYKMGKTESITVKGDEGVEIEGILTKPPKPNGVLIVYPHGGPVGTRDIDIFVRSNQYFASRGYTVLNVNFRGSTGYGKKFLGDGRGQFGKQIEEDITKVVNKIRSKYKFNKTCAMGASYGGYSSMVLAAYHPDVYDCVVATYGVYDLPLLFNASNLRSQQEYRQAVENVVGKLDDSLKQYSPFYFAEKINVPVLLIAGKNDLVSGFEQTNRMKYRLNQFKKEVETLFYAETGHGHGSWLWDRHEHAVIDDFLRRKLNLGPLKGKASRDIRADEAMMIADSYEFDDLVADDPEKALRFYQIAAAEKEPRGIYNLASFYRHGQGTEKNVAKAITLYEQASKLDYEDASFQLGGIYREGEESQQDYKKSLEYFKLAKKQGHKTAWIELVRADCLGYGVPQNLSKCVESLSSSDMTSNHLKMVESIEEEVLFDSNWLKKDRKVFEDYLITQKYHNLSNTEAFEVQNEGLFVRGTFRFEHDETAFVSVPEKNTAIGVEFEIEDQSLPEKKGILLKSQWTCPELTHKKSGKTQSVFRNLVLSRNYTERKVVFNLGKDWNVANGVCTLELSTFDNRLLYKRNFEIVSKQPAK